jgi:hypothetical protein
MIFKMNWINIKTCRRQRQQTKKQEFNCITHFTKRSLKTKRLGPPLQKFNKALPRFFLPEETCFQQAESSALEGTSQAVLGSSDQRKVPASLSLFLKGEKKPQLPLYGGKAPEYRPFRDFWPVPLAYWPLRHRSEITEGPVLRLFSYT